MWKNLLPQGTRTVELCSGFAVLIVSIMLYVGWIPRIPELSSIDEKITWVYVLAIFGCLQILSLYSYPKLELLRTIVSWIAGCFWIWLAVMSIDQDFSAEDVGVFMLGIGNLYGFIINFNLLQISWTD